MKEKITTDLLIADVKKNSKKMLTRVLGTYINFALLTNCIALLLKWDCLLGINLILAAIFGILALIVLYRTRPIIKQIKHKNIEIHEDRVIKKLITRGGKGTQYYLAFQDYQPINEPGVLVSDTRYNQCELDDLCYIIYVKSSAKQPCLLVYTSREYELPENLVDKIRK